MEKLDLPIFYPYENEDQDELLVIRGHHLKNLKNFYLEYLKGSTSPRDFAVKTTSSLPSCGEQYTKDVLGSTTEERTQFEKHLEGVYSKFANLPGYQPVELVEGLPDDICRGCAVGRHCRDINDGHVENRGILVDRAAIDNFLFDAKGASLKYKRGIDIVTEFNTAIFPDAPPQQVRGIKTSLGSVRIIMTYQNTNIL